MKNYWKDKISNDELRPTDISLLFALCLTWQASEQQNPFIIDRRSLMRLSKIASVSTYHACIKKLCEHGYIAYRPSYHPGKRSEVIIY